MLDYLETAYQSVPWRAPILLVVARLRLLRLPIRRFARRRKMRRELSINFMKMKSSKSILCILLCFVLQNYK